MKQTGKRWGLRRLATPEGFFTMAAIDQRPPISKFIARKRGITETDVPDQEMSTIKGLLAQGLAPSAGALLVDPNYGYSAAAEFLRPDRGLLITLEDHRFEEDDRGRKSRLIANWSVEKIRRMGADAVKLRQLGVVRHSGQEAAFLGEAHEQPQQYHARHHHRGRDQVPLADRHATDDLHRGQDGLEQGLRLGPEDQLCDVEDELGQDQCEDEEGQAARLSFPQDIEAPFLGRERGGDRGRDGQQHGDGQRHVEPVQRREHRIERDGHESGLGKIPQAGHLQCQRKADSEQNVFRRGRDPGPEDLDQDDRFKHGGWLRSGSRAA